MISFRRAVLTDAAACAAVERTQPLAAGWGEDGFVAELKQTCAVIWCAQEEKQIIGFVAARAVEDSAEILNVAVLPNYTHRGIGKQLLGKLLANLTDSNIKYVSLEVAQDNIPAQKLYAQAGFTKYNMRKDFYGPGRHALLLGKNL